MTMRTNAPRGIRATVRTLCFTVLVGVTAIAGEAQETPSTHAPSGEFRPPTPGTGHRQDPARNNLIHAEGYVTAELGELGSVRRQGDGPTPLILVAGLGFGGDLFEPVVEALGDAYTVYTVTLPGYGSTSAPPMPVAGTSYGDRTWLAGAQRGLLELIRNKGLDAPLIGAFYSDAANAVVHLAHEHPEGVGGVLLMTAAARIPLPPEGPSRAERMDAFADQWFRTVTEIMWPSGMFPPEVYAADASVAERAWWRTLVPTLPTAIRYQVESWADNLIPVVTGTQVPMIVLSPGFDPDYLAGDRGRNIRTRFHAGWEEAIEQGAGLDHRVVPGARFLIWEDAPDAVTEAAEELARGRRP